MAAEAAISSVAQLLGQLLIHKVNFLRGVEADVQLLIEELNKMQSFLRDANKKQAQDDSVRNWISDIREVALDAEDAIEMFILNVDNPRNSRGLIEHYAHFPSHVHHLHRIGKEIKSIRAKLGALRVNREMYGIRDMGESVSRLEVEARRRLAPWDKDVHLVGVEDDVKKLLEPIMDEEKKGLCATAVVGMGGVGKSTLAREVYNHPDVVSGRFDCRAWVVVSNEFTPHETLKQLILETTRSEREKQERLEDIKKLEESSTRDRLYLQRKLEELLHRRLLGKKYFIVLDDVWEEKHWDSLMIALPKEQDKGSRLLITTRNSIIANHCQKSHEMKGLDPEKSWELFLNKAENSKGGFPNDLLEIGRHIVKKCEGMPLAITVMGGLLAETRSSREWEDARDELDSQLGRAESSISAILELSYHNLSPRLKSCFLCLAFFKEDATIPVKKLVSIMVGQCLIQQTGRTTAEEIARGYLDELINRNMVHVNDLTFDNRVKSCHLHDSLRKICLEKAEEEIGLEIVTGDRRTSSLHKPRHRIMQSDGLGSLSMNKNKHIRSLFVLDDHKDLSEIKSSYWKSFQHLTVLDLDRCHFVQTLPHSFRKLLGLKQLILSRQHNSLPLKLPTWLNTFTKLELLDMRTESVDFINVVLEMDSLRSVYAKCAHGLTITNGWKNVETLKTIKQEDWMRSNLRMTDNCQIRELGILLDHESNILSDSLEKLESLVKLYLVWDYFRVIDASIIPYLRSLTKLKLRGKMTKWVSASMFPPNLTHLTLEKSHLHEDPMQELGKLPKLLYLKLKYNSYMGERMQVLRDAFPSLKGLSLQLLYELRSVQVEEGGMPQLNLLQVDRCYSLDTKNLSSKSYQLQILTDTMRRRWHWQIQGGSGRVRGATTSRSM